MAAPQSPAQSSPSRNRAADLSAWSALVAVGTLFFSAGIPFFWLTWGFYGLALIFLCGVTAVVAGHVGRFRARKLEGAGRGAALFGVLCGWLLIIGTTLVGLLAALASLGLLAGWALLTD